MHPDITTIECHYIQPGRACAFLVREGDEATFIDANTNKAVPYLLEALRNQGLTPEQVRYIVITHVHLDHAGGAAELLSHCPNATILCHPKAARHLVSPDRLVAASKQVYGEELFDRFYGHIGPCAAERVRVMADDEVLQWGTRTFRFLHTLGHATHHLCVLDNTTNALFAGDNFGICYPQLAQGLRPYIFVACTPTEYDPTHTRASLERMLATGSRVFYMNHYGPFAVTEALIEQFLHSVSRTESIIQLAADSGLVDTELRAFINAHVRAATEEELNRCGFELNETTGYWVEPDIALNSNGLYFAVLKRLRKNGAVSANQ